MNGKKLYIFVLVSMTLLAALGVWAMVDGAIAYRQRPMVQDYVHTEGSQSAADPFLCCIGERL